MLGNWENDCNKYANTIYASKGDSHSQVDTAAALAEERARAALVQRSTIEVIGRLQDPTVESVEPSASLPSLRVVDLLWIYLRRLKYKWIWKPSCYGYLMLSMNICNTHTDTIIEVVKVDGVFGFCPGADGRSCCQSASLPFHGSQNELKSLSAWSAWYWDSNFLQLGRTTQLRWWQQPLRTLNFLQDPKDTFAVCKPLRTGPRQYHAHPDAR